MFQFGTRDKRFDPKDVRDFIEIKKMEVQENLEIKPMKRKTKCRTVDIDFQKRKINLELNRVV